MIYYYLLILFIDRTIVMTGLRSDSDIKKESFKKVGEYQDHGDDDHVRWEGKFWRIFSSCTAQFY